MRFEVEYIPAVPGQRWRFASCGGLEGVVIDVVDDLARGPSGLQVLDVRLETGERIKVDRSFDGHGGDGMTFISGPKQRQTLREALEHVTKLALADRPSGVSEAAWTGAVLGVRERHGHGEHMLRSVLTVVRQAFDDAERAKGWSR